MNAPNLDAVGSISREEAAVIAYLYSCPLEAKPKWITIEEVKRHAGRKALHIGWREIRTLHDRDLIYYLQGVAAIALTPAGEVMAKEIMA